jgi:pimeloyl-ACP methyl ester carboxylesterase
MKYSFKDIILIGRSMGTGPACAIAAEFKSIAALVLLSPYTSLKAATRSYMGSLS